MPQPERRDFRAAIKRIEEAIDTPLFNEEQVDIYATGYVDSYDEALDLLENGKEVALAPWRRQGEKQD
ncbi:hypothetical protein SY88_06865 [Clostridiales bacterium PH28_bin88]|nr:hypothetical protein SY88_06865 [Clostridiales bacterium PH28_bin88]